MNAILSLTFGQADVASALSACSAEELDALDFGVIGIDADGVVRAYNSFESKCAGLAPHRVLGHPLFTVVAPCMNNYLVAQRFEDAAADGSPLDSTTCSPFACVRSRSICDCCPALERAFVTCSSIGPRK